MSENELLGFYAGIVRDESNSTSIRMKAGQIYADISPKYSKNTDQPGANVTINNISDQERVQIVFGDSKLIDAPNTINVIPEEFDDLTSEIDDILEDI